MSPSQWLTEAAYTLGWVVDLKPLTRQRSYEQEVVGSASVHISKAGICAHEHIFDSEVNSLCPKCGTESWVKLARVMNVPLSSEKRMGHYAKEKNGPRP